MIDTERLTLFKVYLAIGMLLLVMLLSGCSTIDDLKPGETREITSWGVMITMNTLIVGYWHSYRGPPGGREDSSKPGDVVPKKALEE